MSDLLRRLKPEERRGSKPRCHLLTHGDDTEVAARLTELVSPWGQVRPGHFWLPRGFVDTKEARLGEAPEFLPEGLREEVSKWWLEVRPRANTPNWDIASKCEIQGKAGLMLLEAKAHANELSHAGKPEPETANGWANHEKIGAAIQEANTTLNGMISGWGLSRDTHYQLSNRFVWAWKVASLGVPVLLVYLGFLNADEMSDCGEPFHTADDWCRAVRSHSAGVVPDEVWGENPLDIDGTPLRAIIRSEQIALPPRGGQG